MWRDEARAGLIVAVTSMVFTVGLEASAQYKFETANGHQTVGPSEMGQQPSLSEEFTTKGKIKRKAVPLPALAQPGLPVVQGPNARAGVKTPEGFLRNGSGKEQNQLNNGKNFLGPKAPATVPGGQPSAGTIVLPPGEASTVRVGPMAVTPVWIRAILAVWLLLQFLIMVICAVALQRKETHDINLYQSGHLVGQDEREEIMHGDSRK